MLETQTIASLRIVIAVSILLQTLFIGANAYSLGDVDPRALRGVWRLTSLDDDGLPFERGKQRPGFGLPSPSADPKTIWKLRGYLPMKEFTTYPKKKISDIVDIPTPMTKKQTEIFIKLKDDYTFAQCTALQFSDGVDEENSLEEELEMELSKRDRQSFALKGTWDFVDGKLILAADRPEKTPFSAYDNESSDGETSDTILVGTVAVQSVESLTDHPVLEEQRQLQSDQDEDRATNLSESLPQKGDTVDIHLSVPKGKIKTGKFMYPKNHPSFFEQPIFSPQPNGRFELRQILGEHNAKLVEEDELVELFRKKDLMGKRYYLTTFPLKKRRKKFERWDVKQNKYVKEEYEPTAEEKMEEELQPGNNMQVMAVELHANNTFSTLYGLGSSTILRGKWSIIGEKRDQLWMQVLRFGFGRSVSGSTFSEGNSLTQNDEKVYWGKITEVEDAGKDSTEEGIKKAEIKNGAVMLGWGLEPTTLGRFKMSEIEDVLEEEEDDADEEEEYEYEEMSADDVLKNANNLDSIMGTGDADDIDDGSVSFDQPGAFE